MLHVALATLAAEGVTGFTTRKVAQQAQTSTPAVYELFGDKAGLVREVFFEGFRLLGRHLGRLVRANPVLADVMFSRPFADFDPGPAELRAGAAVREFIVGRVRRCTAAGILRGDDTDIAHVLVALARGLAAQEAAGWLGTSRASMDRRWNLAIRAVLDGLSGPGPGGVA